MENYLVTLKLMVNPLECDRTIDRVYRVTAENEFKAYDEACKKQSNDDERYKHKSVFDYEILELH